MADEPPFPLPPDTVAAIIKGLEGTVSREVRRAMAEPPPPPIDRTYPGDILTGQHAALFQDIIRREVDGVVRRTVDEKNRDIQAQIARFLTEERIVEVIKREGKVVADAAAVELLKDIGLRADGENAEKTGDALRSILKWQKRFEVAGNTILGGLILSAFYGLAKVSGFKLPPALGGGP